jgi:dienelactone hydrolase
MKTVKPELAFDETKDFDTWREQVRAKLTELLGDMPKERCDLNIRVEWEKEHEDFYEKRMIYTTEPNADIPCHLLIPAGATGPLPVAICLQGHSTGMHYSLGYKKFPNDSDESIASRCFAIQAIRQGICAIAMDQRYMGAAGQQENGAPSCLRNYTALAAMMWGRTAIGERVWDISRLIDVIECKLTQYIDPKRIICMGNSGGGTATFYAACLEDRIHLAIPSCAVCTYEDSIMAMHHCACNYIPGIRKYFEMGDLGCLAAPRKMIVVSGQNDKIFPIAGAKASCDIIRSAYEKANVPQNFHMVIGDGGHQFYPDETWPIAMKMLQNN